MVSVTTAAPTLADQRPSFGDLLAQAQMQASAGHRWSPPGDNMTETIAAMMDLIPSATPKQLADLSALLEADATRLPPPSAQASLKPVPRGVVTETSVPPDRGAAAPSAPNPDVANLGMPSAGGPSLSMTDRGLPGGGAADRGLTGRSPPSLGLTDRVSPDLAASRPADPVVVRPGPRAAELFSRGQEAERAGDVSGARRYYATAADQGSPTAARSLGRLYDPAYLTQMAMGGIDADPGLARRWYERAVAMGDTQAAPLLQALAAR